jgi:hypothetical protein
MANRGDLAKGINTTARPELPSKLLHYS